jgi:hypothetical protein
MIGTIDDRDFVRRLTIKMVATVLVLGFLSGLFASQVPMRGVQATGVSYVS